MEGMLPLIFQDLFGPGIVLGEDFLFIQFLQRIFIASVIFVFVTIPLPAFLTGFSASEKSPAWLNFIGFCPFALVLLAVILQTVLSVVSLHYSPLSIVIGLAYYWMGACIREMRKLCA